MSGSSALALLSRRRRTLVPIAVIGAGYVGLVVAACFAKLGHRVHCVESDPDKLAALRNGNCPIYEPELDALLSSESRRLSFSDDLGSAVAESAVCFVCVGTPEGADGAADLTATRNALSAIAAQMPGYRVIVLKSTVPVGTHQIARRLIRAASPHDFDVVSNPEFLREGSAVSDFLKPDRVVIGVASALAEAVMRELYAPVLAGTPSRLIVMDNTSAELTKYAANAMLATRISFINEIANLCEKLGGDVSQVRAGIETDRRIGPHFLNAGLGYGGCCFPKDVHALIHTGIGVGRPLDILSAVDRVNRTQRLRLAEKIESHFGESVAGARFALWGLAFKPHTDDVRDAPAVATIQWLLSRGARVVAYDPKANAQALGDRARGVAFARDAYSALEGADALIVATEWPEFVSQALRGEPLTVYGDGSQTRSFCYVDDLVKGLMRLFSSNETNPVNLGNPAEYPILEFARQILSAAGSSSCIEFRDLPVDDPKQRRPDIGRAKRILAFEPKVPLAEGLNRTIESFRQVLARRNGKVLSGAPHSELTLRSASHRASA